MARAFGRALRGRLCVIGPHLTQSELPSLLCAALHSASRARVWRGVASPSEAPLLLASGGEIWGRCKGDVGEIYVRYGRDI